MLSCASHAQDTQSNIDCLVDLELPLFAVVNSVRSGGTVVASVAVGWDGKPGHIDFESTHRSLMLEVEYHLRDKAEYNPKCAGKTVTLVFTFRTVGKPTYYGFPRTHFRPPNQFVIIRPPDATSVDILPLSPPPTGESTSEDREGQGKKREER